MPGRRAVLVFGLLLLAASGSLLAQAPLSVAAMMSIVHRTGEDSAIAAELANALGIPIAAGASQLAVKGRAYEEGKLTLTAFVSAQAGRDYLILVEENDSGTIFLLTTSAGKAEKGLMQSATDPALRPLPAGITEQLLKQRIAIWQKLLKP